ncbi:MAG TPA: hypothetical protein DDW65_14970 [Firmicutes bacterium]|jgi:hypothetical protein|nr:hypothetical protein [Bacillota bacterium]
MQRNITFSETIFTPLIPERVFKVADECLLEVRLVETRKELSSWIYEYEVSGEYGKIEKFLVRIHHIEILY